MRPERRVLGFLAQDPGPARPPDLLLGQRAIARGFLTPRDLASCLDEQEATLARGERILIGKILIDRGFLDAARLDVLLSEQRSTPFRYELHELVGEGAMGEVYRATDLELNRPVALKFFKNLGQADSTQHARFRREAQTAAGLAHPNVITVYDAGERDGRWFLVMELVTGRSLRRVFKEQLPERALLEILEQSARGIAAAHKLGIVHRDVKPDNIIVTAQGVPKIGDFGLARGVDAGTALTRSGATLGTPLYMSPEQAAGRSDVTPRADVYALGVMLYEIITGRLPCIGETAAEVLAKTLAADFVPPRGINPRISRDLESICLKGLEKNPLRRYPDATAFADDLRCYLGGRPVRAHSSAIPYRVRKLFGRHWRSWLVAVAAASLLLSVGILLKPTGDLKSTEFALHLSTSYLELVTTTRDSMLVLEDSAMRADPGPEDARHLAAIDRAADRVAARHPNLRLPAAWKGLARCLARRAVEGEPMLIEACLQAGDDPFPELLRARFLLHKYFDDLSMPTIKVVGDRVEVGPFGETAESRACRNEALVLLGRATGRDVWRLMNQGTEFLEFAEGIRDLIGNETGRAMARFAKLQSDPLFSTQASWLLALCRFKKGDMAGAAQIWESEAPRRWAWSLRLACTCRIAQSDVEQNAGRDPSGVLKLGLDDANEAIRLHPGNADGFEFRGRIRTRLAHRERVAGRDPIPLLDEAISDYDKALALAGLVARYLEDGASTTRARGDAEFRKGGDPSPFYRQAMLGCEKAVEVDSSLFTAWSLRGRIALVQAELPITPKADAATLVTEAIRDFGEALRLAPGDASARQGRGKALHVRARFTIQDQGDPSVDLDEAIAEFDRAFRSVDVPPDGYCERGQALCQKGMSMAPGMGDPASCFKRAVDDFELALQRDPKNPLFLYWHARALVLMGNAARDVKPYLERAEHDLRTALESQRTSAILTLLGSTLLAKGDRTGALEFLEESLSLNPHQPVVEKQVREIKEALK